MCVTTTCFVFVIFMPPTRSLSLVVCCFFSYSPSNLRHFCIWAHTNWFIDSFQLNVEFMVDLSHVLSKQNNRINRWHFIWIESELSCQVCTWHESVVQQLFGRKEQQQHLHTTQIMHIIKYNTRWLFYNYSVAYRTRWNDELFDVCVQIWNAWRSISATIKRKKCSMWAH